MPSNLFGHRRQRDQSDQSNGEKKIAGVSRFVPNFFRRTKPEYNGAQEAPSFLEPGQQPDLETGHLNQPEESGFRRRMQLFSTAITEKLGLSKLPIVQQRTEEEEAASRREEYDRQVRDLLDVIDPEVSTLATLTDVQNSLFVPNLGRWVNRTNYLRLTHSSIGDDLEGDDYRRAAKTMRKSPSKSLPQRPHQEDEASPQRIVARGEYFILPEGLVDCDHWTNEERAELDDYVRHLLVSKRWKLRRQLRGFGQYCRTPLGAFVTIYASLLTFWGAAWVLFLIGWLSAGSRTDYFIEICDEILTALFCTVGIGLAPFRAVDTYHMYHIARLHRKTLRLYEAQGLPPLPDQNDLPDIYRHPEIGEHLNQQPVLSVEEQALLIYHQQRFSKSHTFYRPHETSTHKAFPYNLLIVVVTLLDFHSIFQIALGSTTWSISYHHNFKRILTSIILSFSITCNISAGMVITLGNRRTRKTEVIEERLRTAVTEEAVRRKQKQTEREEQEKGDERRIETTNDVTGGGASGLGVATVDR